MKILDRDFYLRDTITVSKELLGKYLVHEYNGFRLAGRITETESYIGPVDKACHAYNYKRTPRTEPLFASGGIAYVYFIYGVYFCMNVVTESEGTPCAVLIRGLEMMEGLEEASRLRYEQELSMLSKKQLNNFANGPGKLCRALHITREQNCQSLLEPPFYICDRLEDFENTPFTIHESKRIGIDYAEEAKDFLWRFYILH